MVFIKQNITNRCKTYKRISDGGFKLFQLTRGFRKGMKFSSNLIHFSGKELNFCTRSSLFPAKDKNFLQPIRKF